MLNAKNLITALITIPLICSSQNNADTITLKRFLNEVNINVLRADETTPIAFTNLTKNDINKSNLGQDLPYLISLTPSVVSSSDAGTGIGYTSFRLRGSDATRINVTINGIPLNDSESQGVWWVNIPDLASSLANIQIQRGVGISTNGSSAFGGAINLQTDKLSKIPYSRTSNTVGSFGTIKNNISFGTGLIENRFLLEGRLSKIQSEGYIDRATADLTSFYLSGNYYTNNTSLKALIFGGKEITYQAWYGIPYKYLENDSTRTFNPYNYENEVDNYKQTHYQLHYTRKINQKSSFNLAAHYTHGEGYYEQYKEDESFADYNLSNLIINTDTIKETNLIRRKWLNNDFGGLTYSFKHQIEKYKLVIGGATNRYEGQHYGNIIWSQYASNANYNHQYYWNKGLKLDHTIYAKTNYYWSDKTSLYLDLQRRRVEYEFKGYDENGKSTDQIQTLAFFNPKIGIHHSLNDKQIVYASFAVGNKEPNRDDYVEAEYNSYPKHETLHDYEIGYKIINKNLIFGANTFYMHYLNQLVPTGELNNVGAYIRTNVDKSFRNGIEIFGSSQLTKNIQWTGNLTLSENKIVSFTEFIDNWDSGKQDSVLHNNSDIAFSPKTTWASQFNYKITDNITIDFISKYVGKQFIDNTSSKERMLDDYLINHLRMSYSWRTSFLKKVNICLQVNNIMNNRYTSNAWVYRFISENYDPRAEDDYVSKSRERGYSMASYFPQAGRNYLLNITLEF